MVFRTKARIIQFRKRKGRQPLITLSARAMPFAAVNCLSLHLCASHGLFAWNCEKDLQCETNKFFSPIFKEQGKLKGKPRENHVLGNSQHDEQLADSSPTVGLGRRLIPRLEMVGDPEEYPLPPTWHLWIGRSVSSWREQRGREGMSNV